MKAVFVLAVLLPVTNAMAAKSYVLCRSSRQGAAAAAALLNHELDSGTAIQSRDGQGNGVTHLPKGPLSISQPTVVVAPEEDPSNPEVGSTVVCVTVTGEFWDERN